MKYINTKTGEYPLTERQIRQANPLRSYPKPFQAEGYSPVAETTPDYDPVTQNATETDPALVEGVWTQQWVITAKTAEETETFLAALREKHKKQAQAEQETVLDKISKNQLKKSLGLPPEISDADEAALKEYTKTIQADIDNPPETVAYNPPLPPGVTPPAINSILITITREAGWQGNIGWKAVISSGEDNFTPTSLAMAEYTNPSCDGYLYTTGAFQQDGDTWYAVCPPGQEKGDVDVNLGLLYGAAQLACFTFKAGNQEQKVYAYEEVI